VRSVIGTEEFGVKAFLQSSISRKLRMVPINQNSTNVPNVPVQSSIGASRFSWSLFQQARRTDFRHKSCECPLSASFHLLAITESTSRSLLELANPKRQNSLKPTFKESSAPANRIHDNPLSFHISPDLLN
jgi:hypothetical protein